MSQSVKIERKLMALEGPHHPKSINKPLVGKTLWVIEEPIYELINKNNYRISAFIP
jgi:hypothetical protein